MHRLLWPLVTKQGRVVLIITSFTVSFAFAIHTQMRQRNNKHIKHMKTLHMCVGSMCMIQKSHVDPSLRKGVYKYMHWYWVSDLGSIAGLCEA